MNTKNGFCAFCSEPRKFVRKKHLSAVDVLMATLATGLLMLAFWQSFEPRALLILAFILGIAETFMIMRWRVAIACPYCGFDPVVYKRNPEQAATMVQHFMKTRREDPAALLKKVARLKPIAKPSVVGLKPGARSSTTGAGVAGAVQVSSSMDSDKSSASRDKKTSAAI